MLRKIWERLSTASPFQSVEKRQFQHEIDIHRLFLLTSYKRLDQGKEEVDLAAIEARASRTNFEEWKEEVQKNIGEQVRLISSTLDNILLLPSHKSTPQAAENLPKRPSGLSFAVGSAAPVEIKAETIAIPTLPLTQAQVSAAFKNRLGFTLELNPSTIAHREAGVGSYISGKAGAGSVVSFYPGVTYAPAQYRYLPGYPRVELGNPYLVSRFDGLVIDGNPWGRGGDARQHWDGITDREKEIQQNILKSMDANEETRTAADKLWQLVGGGKKMERMIEGAVLERRNPLAFAHFANHPPKGGQPNVMLCPYNLPIAGDGRNVRPYIPNVRCAVDTDIEMQQSGLLWVRKGRKEEDLHQTAPQVSTLLLVATRDVCDEELLLNYRYSNFKNRPAWYHSVDEEEDRRRWE